MWAADETSHEDLHDAWARCNGRGHAATFVDERIDRFAWWRNKDHVISVKAVIAGRVFVDAVEWNQNPGLLPCRHPDDKKTAGVMVDMATWATRPVVADDCEWR